MKTHFTRTKRTIATLLLAATVLASFSYSIKVPSSSANGSNNSGISTLGIGKETERDIPPRDCGDHYKD